jgi:hypothetical protein
MTTPTSRSIISPVVAVAFAVVAITGVLMLMHIRSRALNGVHEMAGLAMAVAGVVHLVLNWRAFVALFRHRRAIVACAVTAALSVGLYVAGLMAPERPHGPRGPQAGASALRMR